MKKHPILIVSAVLLSAGNPFAAEEGGFKVQIQPQANPGAPGAPLILNAGGSWGKPASAWYIEGIEKTVKLTPAQKEAMTKIIETRDKAAKELQEKNGEKMRAAMQAMADAYKSKDSEAIAKAQKNYAQASGDTTKLYKQAQTDLDNVLTAEQKAQRQEQSFAQAIKWMTEPAKLTAEQTEKIKAILAKQSGAGGREGGERTEREGNEAVQNVLTADQKALIAKHRAVSYAKMMFGNVKLTAEQSQKIEAAYDELAKTPNLNREGISKKLSEKITGLLTAEQKEAMKLNVWTAAPGSTPATTPRKPAPGQPAQLKPGAPNVIRIGEGGEGITVTINGEKVKAAQGEPKSAVARTFAIGEGGRESGWTVQTHQQNEKGPWLGLAMEPASEALRAQLSLGKEEGLLVSHIVQSSPANKAGLARNDILLRLDDQILVEPSQLRKLISMKKPGDHVKLTYMRKAERKETTATLIEHTLESAEHPSLLDWSEAPSQHRRTEGRDREVIEQLNHALKTIVKKAPGSAPQENPYAPRLNPTPGAPLLQNPYTPRRNPNPDAVPQNLQPLGLKAAPGAALQPLVPTTRHVPPQP